MKGVALPDARLDAPHLVVGRVLRLHGRGQLVRGVPLLRPRPGSFKVWGGIGLFLVFALLQGVWLARHHDRGDGVSRRASRHRDRATSPRRSLRARLAAARAAVLEIHDDSAAHAGHAGAAGGGGHFSLLIVSKAFSGLSRLARHQRVLREVADLVPHPIHALSIKALAPEEFPSQP